MVRIIWISIFDVDTLSIYLSYLQLLSNCSTLIQKIMKEGKLVPSEITVRLLHRAMEESKSDKFLIDGFPRDEENRTTFENIVSFQKTH